MENNLYPATSPYFTSDIVDAKYLDVMIDRSFPALASDLFWTITPVYEFRPDLLAYDMYGDSKLWWVFAHRNPNRLKDPYFDFVAGIGIYIPKQATLTQYLGL